MKIDLDPSAFSSKDAYVRATLSKARDLAVLAWENEHSERRTLIERSAARFSSGAQRSDPETRPGKGGPSARDAHTTGIPSARARSTPRRGRSG